MKKIIEKKQITLSTLKSLLKESNERFDYKNEVFNDLVDFIKEFGSDNEWETKSDYEDNRDDIYDEAFIADEVTGNGSGSYTGNAWIAEENLTHNWDLLKDAMDSFGDHRNAAELGPETCDSIIRCYIMGQVLDKAIEFATKGLP